MHSPPLWIPSGTFTPFNENILNLVFLWTDKGEAEKIEKQITGKESEWDRHWQDEEGNRDSWVYVDMGF